MHDADIQGTKIYGGYLYQAFGGSAATEQLITKIDLSKKEMITYIDFYPFAPNEMEDFDIDFKTKTVYWSVIADYFGKAKF